jgi:hypothetical protein
MTLIIERGFTLCEFISSRKLYRELKLEVLWHEQKLSDIFRVNVVQKCENICWKHNVLLSAGWAEIEKGRTE